MEDINIIYKTNIGLSFYWKRGPLRQVNKLNIVINDIALHLSYSELTEFSKNIDTALSRKSAHCKDCPHKSNCEVTMLETPIPQITFVKSYQEIKSIQDLVKGTLFELDLNSMLKEIL
ncbi:hypothetical protein [Seonamhaeicola sp. ML3]|uniref:hypothetical protein n=1 Tax=Seonamhaeicola sp. ML3 TaxID=2937786 RepID=UPI00201091DF|nr:hypothetical protein [Seonamhaeicola sp. ML3]